MTIKAQDFPITRLVLLFGLLAGFLKMLPIPSAQAATLVVTNNNSSGPGSLSQTITNTVAGDTITFDFSLSGTTIPFNRKVISKDLIIDASYLSYPVTLAGNSQQFFQVSFGVRLELRHLILDNGSYNGLGGAINNQGTLVIRDSVISNNAANSFGGAIYNTGDLTLTDTFFLNNHSSQADGGAIFNMGTATIESSTFRGNYTSYDGGAIFSSGVLSVTNNTFYQNSPSAIESSGQLTILNSTLANNGGFGVISNGNYSTGPNTGTLKIDNTILANNGSEDCYNNGAIILSFISNLVEVGTCGTPLISSDPNLDVPRNINGIVETMALLPGSPAIGAANLSLCPDTDQRGTGRLWDGFCDIGAYEFDPARPPTTITFVPATPCPTITTTASPTGTTTFLPTFWPSTPTPTPTASASPTRTATGTATFGYTPTSTATASATGTATTTPTRMPTFDPTMIPGGAILRVSVDSGEVQGNNDSYFPAISADGRYIVFNSYASNLVSGDTNGASDIFVHDMQTHLTRRVSVDSNGIQGNGHSYRPVVSADGRYIAFDSDASNLVPGDTNGNTDVFVHDQQTGVTTRMSVRSDGWQGLGTSLSPSVSADGRYVAFHSSAANLAANDTNLANDIFLHDRQTGETRRISTAFGGMQVDHDSRYPSISADGRYIAFESEATNLIPGDTNGVMDIFRYDNLTGQILRVSVDSYEQQANGHSRAPSISADGSLIAFESGGTNLVSGDTNAHTDIFLHDTSTGTTTRVSVDSNGLQANHFSEAPSISVDGRYIAFESAATNLVPGDDNPYIDAFVHDRVLHQTTWVSAGSIDGRENGQSGQSVLSADGQFLAFTSWASNLVPYDTNLRSDVFVYRQTFMPAATATVSPSQTPLPTPTPVINHDRDTTGVFRPSNGLLYLKNSNDTGFADIAINYGLPGDFPVVGDWDGNGTATIGVYRNGYFYLKNSNTLGFADVIFRFGAAGDQPIAGDWNGDGVDTIGVYRPSNGLFLLRNDNSEGPADKSFYLGNVGDVGIAGDWDGDELDTTGVFRPSNGVIFLKNKNEGGFADMALNYGLPGDQPVTGDWDNDGIDTIGVYRNGLFLLRNENTIGFAEIIFGLGNPGDLPIAGNWDGLP